MRGMSWLFLFVFALAIGGLFWYSRRRFETQRRAEEARLASFLAQTAGRARLVEQAPVVVDDGLAQQKLLFDAARKAGEAGEPALAIQLYARLLSRYPASGLADQARAEVAAQKKKLAKA